MKSLIALAALTLTTGCAAPRGHEVYNLNNIVVVLDTQENINKAYKMYVGNTTDRVAGFQVGNTVYCRHDDNYTLGHEVRHLLEGKFHR